MRVFTLLHSNIEPRAIQLKLVVHDAGLMLFQCTLNQSTERKYMKSITEFAQPILQKVLAAKAALTTEGKTAEEIAASVGESFKFEGEKLKYVLAAADLVEGKTAVRRVLVASFAEGEAAPAKYQKIEETHYLVETLETTKVAAPVATKLGARGGNGPRKGNSPSGPKSSPWGASPEEIAAKKKSSSAAAAAKK